jgi:cytochrome c peroxidase
VKRLLTTCCLALAVLAAQQKPLSRVEANRRAQSLEALGRKLFFDPALSGSGRLSCASCHDPAFAYGPPNALAAQKGGVDLTRSGHRAAPSLRYLQAVPPFSEHYYDAEASGDDSADAGPTGGLTWDGRVDRLRDQARIPLLSPFESANANPAAVVAVANRAPYAAELRRLAANSDPFETILEALEAFQQDYREFYPYSSKYDEWLAGKATLTEAESRGLKLFEDPAKGDCARCHVSARGATGTPPQFTDYGMVALGLPRNPEIPANADPAWFDLGLCGPDRTDLQSREEYCGKFRTPSLRNVALRQAFFHNGVFHTLQEAVEFYAKRDANSRFDDLPPKYRINLETGAPFGRAPGSAPSLSDAEIDDIVAFLKTLTDRPTSGGSFGRRSD